MLLKQTQHFLMSINQQNLLKANEKFQKLTKLLQKLAISYNKIQHGPAVKKNLETFKLQFYCP